jgi:hypothetical protein
LLIIKHVTLQKIGAHDFLYDPRNIPGTISHNHLLSIMSFIPGKRPVQRLLVEFCNKLIFYGEELLAPCPTPQAGGPPLVGCLRLLIQYIHSQLPSKTGGSLFHPQPEDAPCRGDKGPT